MFSRLAIKQPLFCLHLSFCLLFVNVFRIASGWLQDGVPQIQEQDRAGPGLGRLLHDLPVVEPPQSILRLLLVSLIDLRVFPVLPFYHAPLNCSSINNLASSTNLVPNLHHTYKFFSKCSLAFLGKNNSFWSAKTIQFKQN